MKEKKIICIVNFKGGVGKTTTAVNLCANLALRGKRTLLVDMDPQASATYHLWDHDFYQKEIAGGKRTIAHLLYRAGKEMAYKPEDFILPFPHSPNGQDLSKFEILPGDSQLIKLDQGLNNRPITLDSVLNPLRDSYDYIIIDSPPVMYSVVRNNILASDYYLVPTIPDHLSTSGIRHLLETLQSYFTKYENLIRDRQADMLGVLFTRYGGLNIAMHKRFYARVKDDFINGVYDDCGFPAGEDRVFKTIIRERIDVQQSAENHKPLCLQDPNGDATVDYKRLAKEVEQILSVE